MINLKSTQANPIQALQQQMLMECEEMARHALALGLKVPDSVWKALEAFAHQESTAGHGTGQNPHAGMPELATVHEQLSEIVAPATPRTIMLLATEAKTAGFWHFLGPLAMARHMMVAAVISLAVFMGVGLSSYVNASANFGNIFQSSGWSAFFAQLFLLSAAGLGASFHALYQSNRYITEGTFDPKYIASYWVRFAMGLVSGILLAELLGDSGSESLSTQGMSRPILAMVGGFSASVVYRMLTRLVDTVESLVRGDTRAVQAAQEQAAKAQQSEKSTQANMKLAANLIGVHNMLQTGTDPTKVQQNVGQILGHLVHGSYEPASPQTQSGSPSTQTPPTSETPSQSPASPQAMPAQTTPGAPAQPASTPDTSGNTEQSNAQQDQGSVPNAAPSQPPAPSEPAPAPTAIETPQPGSTETQNQAPLDGAPATPQTAQDQPVPDAQPAQQSDQTQASPAAPKKNTQNKPVPVPAQDAQPMASDAPPAAGQPSTPASSNLGKEPARNVLLADTRYAGLSLGANTQQTDATHRATQDLQRHLRALGYLRSGIDGIFGSGTEGAIKALQYDLMHNNGADAQGGQGAPVAVNQYNKGRVTQMTGVVDEGTAACIQDMIQDPNFVLLPLTDDPNAANATMQQDLAGMSFDQVPEPVVVAILKQESDFQHFHVPYGRDEDKFIVVGCDTNDAQVPERITSRGYGAGQYTLFHHPPRRDEVAQVMLNASGNVQQTLTELRTKFDHFILGSTPATKSDDRYAEIGSGPLRLCKYDADDPRYLKDCVACMKNADKITIQSGTTPFYAGSSGKYESTIYHQHTELQNVPDRKTIGCDWPYAIRRYNGSGVNSYWYQAEVLLKIEAETPPPEGGSEDPAQAPAANAKENMPPDSEQPLQGPVASAQSSAPEQLARGPTAERDPPPTAQPGPLANGNGNSGVSASNAIQPQANQSEPVASGNGNSGLLSTHNEQMHSHHGGIMGFGSLLKKVAKTGASVALKTATQAATGGLGGVAVGAIKLATDKEDRVQQLTGVLANAAGSGKLKGVAELMDDITSLGKLVKSARADKQITMEEMDAIFEAVEQLEEDAKGALGGLV